MNWKNASIDEPPPHEEEVVICVDGVYYLAIYDKSSDIYRLIEEQETSFDPKEALIYWLQSFP